MTRSSLRNAVIVGGLCFALGLVAMRSLVSLFQTNSAPAAYTPVANSESYQTYAALLIDDYTSRQPRVDGVWLAWIPDDYSTVEVIGLPPGPFQNAYAPDPRGVPAMLLQPFIRGPLGGTFVLDRSDMVELADAVGGLQVEGAHIQGKAVLDYYLDPAIDSDVSLIRQGAVIQALIARIAVRGTNLNYETLLQVPSWCSILQDPLYETVRHYYPLHTDQIRVKALLTTTP